MADDDLREEVRRLRKEVDALQRRVSTLEESTDASEAEERPLLGTSHTEDTSPGAPPESATGRPADPTDEEPDSGRDWERTIGVHWLGIAGALALVVGVVFFVRLAIEMGLLGPLGRVTVGTLGGIALFGGGRYAAVRQGYRRWGRITAGAGIAIAYFSVYAAYGFEGYRDAIGTPLWAVLLALTLLVVAVVAVSLRDGAPVLVGEAFLFG